MFERDAAHRGLIQPLLGYGLGTGRGQAVIEALGQRAGLSMTRLVGVLTGLVAGDVLQHPQ